MENPEEILHCLEEFSKMKPKDIPRELEEYLKFVAKTGDPIYQWPAIKSLFREKFIHVITEFYESCSSSIPPCPNVEMFNYNLMKNFILEKLDTFASAPFTLQRICELLTNPRKQYSRIDKYMRALEKNILVVSTMEPGDRRTENGDGIMNGIESDHEHVPEPGNEINVEEMDDSPYVQTTNHIEEHISFENSKNGTHIEIDSTLEEKFTSEKISSEASTSSQEIVCVQYVSIEPVASNNPQSTVEETKEADISVTITAVNVKDDTQAKSEVVHNDQQTEAIVQKNISGSTEVLMDEINAPAIETEADVQMETEPVESTKESPTAIEQTEVIVPQSTSEITLSTTVTDKLPEELVQPQISLKLEVAGDTESVSPENSITSSDNPRCELRSESNILVEAQPSDVSVPVDSSPKETVTDQEDEKVTNTDNNVEKDNPDTVHSTTTAVEDNPECKVSKSPENESNEVEIPKESPLEVSPSEASPDIQSAECDSLDSSDANEINVKTDVPPTPIKPNEEPKISEITEPLKEVEAKVEEPVESKIDEVSSLSEEKETPMEVDAEQEETSDDKAKEEMLVKEPEPTEIPEIP